MRPPQPAFNGRPSLSLGALPRRAACLVLGLERHLRNLLAAAKPQAAPESGDGPLAAPLLLAVSGGADSTALTCLLSLLAERLDITLRAATCDHGLRPSSADEAAFAAELCRWLGIPCVTLRLPAPDGAAGLEARCRALRYAALERARREAGCRYILTAHHAGDLAEDMLMRLTRGTGWPALGGMAALDGERRLLRPLLETDPADLRLFLRDIGVPHCEDESNADTGYTRNRVRHAILPLLERENPRLRRSLLRLARQARLDREFFDAELDRALRTTPWEELPGEGGASGPGAIRLPRRLLSGLAPALRPRLVLRAVRVLSRDGGQARGEALMALCEALEEGGRPRVFQMCGGIEADCERGQVTVRRAGSPAGA